ncbi:hypothetical protein ACFC09_39010 [Streptomyces sp. NPDC056161]|uniref:hypothetical protein n=1 Tax=Streptomyces sp. NPDC056161 TaxID=3345732 RepID=UPI0035DBC7FD
MRTAALRVPCPRRNVRHVSDLVVSPTDRIETTSASDAGDDGPFDPAVHDAGTVRPGPLPVRGAAPVPTVRPEPVGLARFDGHEVEALARPSTARTGVLGTDDENLDGAIRTADMCLARAGRVTS